MPGKFSEFKISVGKFTASLASQTVSIDLYDTKFPGNNYCIFRLKSSTSTIFGAKIGHSLSLAPITTFEWA